MFIGQGLFACEGNISRFLIFNTGSDEVTWTGEDHKRQRKIELPAFSAASIKRAFPAFFDSSHNVFNSFFLALNIDNPSFLVTKTIQPVNSRGDI